MYGEEIGVVGDSYLADQLGWIALTIFARTSDVASGNFEIIQEGGEQIAQGVHLGFARAGNKGGICLPFRFHNLSFLAVAAHLPADGPYGSRAVQRNAALRQLLSGGSSSWDLHLQYHHTILLGKAASQEGKELAKTTAYTDTWPILLSLLLIAGQVI